MAIINYQKLRILMKTGPRVQCSQQIKLFLCLQESTEQLKRDIAEHLAQVPGAFLTTTRGIGLILAAGVSGEIGGNTGGCGGASTNEITAVCSGTASLLPAVVANNGTALDRLSAAAAGSLVDRI